MHTASTAHCLLLDEMTDESPCSWQSFSKKRDIFLQKINTEVPDAKRFTREILTLCKAKWIHYIIANAWELFGHLFFEVNIEQEIMNEKTGYGMLVYFEQVLGRAKIRELILLTVSQMPFDSQNRHLNCSDLLSLDGYSFCEEINNRAQALWGRMELYCIVRGKEHCLALFETGKVMQDFILFMVEKSSRFRLKLGHLGYRTMLLVDSHDGRQFLAGPNTRDDFCKFPSAAGYKPNTGRMLISEYRWFANNKLAW